MQKILIFFSLCLFSSCMNVSRDNNTTIFINSNVVNYCSSELQGSCFAVENGKIVAIGTQNKIQKEYKNVDVVDLNGGYVFPGFNDAHCHFYAYATNLAQYCNLKETQSFDDVIDRLIEYNEKYNPDFLCGRGWDQNDWEQKEMPDWNKLNNAFPDKPVYLVRIDGHAALTNKKAFEIAEINTETKVDGGEIRVKDGKYTGLLIDNAMSIIRSLIPKPNQQQIIDALLIAQDSCFKYGLTSLTDAGLDKNQIVLIDSLQKTGDLKIRINVMISASKENFEYFENEFEETERLKISSIKLFSDGALGSRGACLIENYSDDPQNKGFIINDIKYYKEVCRYAYNHNLQVCTHCIGDSANRLILDIYSEFLKGENDRRWRIEHAQVVNENDIDKFGKYSIIPSIQSTHATSDMYWAEERLGSVRINDAYQTRRLLYQNGWLPNGTDFPVEDISPIETFYAAIFRQDKKYYPEGGFLNSQCFTRQEALKSITFWPAMASFDENVKGKIKEGMFADFVILDKDIMTCKKEEILDAKVLEVWIGGEKVK